MCRNLAMDTKHLCLPALRRSGGQNKQSLDDLDNIGAKLGVCNISVQTTLIYVCCHHFLCCVLVLRNIYEGAFSC